MWNVFYLQFTSLEERLSVDEEYIMQEAERGKGKRDTWVNDFTTVNSTSVT